MKREPIIIDEPNSKSVLHEIKKRIMESERKDIEHRLKVAHAKAEAEKRRQHDIEQAQGRIDLVLAVMNL